MRKKQSRIGRIRSVVRAGGATYLTFFVRHWVLHRVLNLLSSTPLRRLRVIDRVVEKLRLMLTQTDNALISLEQEKGIAEPWTITSRYRFTVAENREWWNRHDWSQRGEEWTPTTEWKMGLVNRFLNPYVPEGGTALEIGPGAGRWTEFLAQRSTTLFVVEVSERALDLCRARFGGSPNVQFLLTEQAKIDVPDSMVDVIWSYDVFVHINPADTRAYFSEFGRVLKPGGHIVIHHPGAPAAEGHVRPGTRSDLTDDMVLAFARANGLEHIEQTREFVNPGDVLSVFRKPR
jgi:SAM-dependent methyltransferase